MEEVPDELPSFLQPKKTASGTRRTVMLLLKVGGALVGWFVAWALHDMAYRGVPLTWHGLRWWLSLWL